MKLRNSLSGEDPLQEDQEPPRTAIHITRDRNKKSSFDLPTVAPIYIRSQRIVSTDRPVALWRQTSINRFGQNAYRRPSRMGGRLSGRQSCPTWKGLPLRPHPVFTPVPMTPLPPLREAVSGFFGICLPDTVAHTRCNSIIRPFREWLFPPIQGCRLLISLPFYEGKAPGMFNPMHR